MGKRTHVPETPLGRDTEGTERAEKVQIHVGGKRSVVYSFLGTLGY